MQVLEQLFLKRPRLLNILHRFSLVKPTSQTTREERNALARYSIGCQTAVEIGTYQGLSSVYIAASMNKRGKLWCVDPWPTAEGATNPCWSICERHFKRSGIESRVEIVRDYSCNVDSKLPHSIDFAFIDGDHSWAGIECDWSLMAKRIRSGGYICLHDSIVPKDEPWRASLDSNRYFEEIIKHDARFELVECVHSLVVLRRI